MIDPILVFRDVSKVYRAAGGTELRALHGVSFEVPPGRVVAVIGRSGSGKSTLLHVAAGIERPTSGSVRFLGRDLAALSDREATLARRDGVGLVFQFFHLLPHLSVRDNVALPSLIAADPREACGVRVDDLLRRVDLAGRADEAVQKLSGGEMQRVALCRALLRKPRLLLADEPTGSLDDESGRRVMGLLLGLAREEGSALLCVTHSSEVAALADERWRLHSGILERA